MTFEPKYVLVLFEMSATQPLPDPDALDPREARAAERVAALERLSAIGMALAEVLERRVSEAIETGDEIGAGAAALGYSRVSRAVRQTLALKARLDRDAAALAQRVKAERAAALDEAMNERLRRGSTIQ